MPFPTDNLALLQQQAAQVHLKHAARPAVWGVWAMALSLWARYYEAKSALRDANPLFAALLLPRAAPTALPTPGLPLVPVGTLSLIDYARPGTATLTLDIAGPITLTVTTPAGNSFPVTPTQGPTRQSATFPASADGLYTATVKSGASIIATLYVSVERGLFHKFRQISRYLKYDFVVGRPVIPNTFKELLAVLYFMDAAAATGQPTLYHDLRVQALALEPAPTPIALFGK